MARKRGKKKKNQKRKGSGSSTTETSTQSVDDDTQQLLKSSASGDGRKSRADEKTKKDKRWNLLRKPSPLPSQDADASGNSPQSDRLTVPDPENSTSRSKKGDRKSFLERLSPKRSSVAECSCEGGNHNPECPKSKNLPVDANEGFGGARPKTTFSKKPKEGTQSSSSSDPSKAGNFASATESSEQSSERSDLLDPNRGAGVASISPSKKSGGRLSSVGRLLNRLSGTESSLEDKSNELKHPEQRRHKTDLKNKPLKGKTPNPKLTTSETSTNSSGSKSYAASSNTAVDLYPPIESLRLPARVERIMQKASSVDVQETQNDAILIDLVDVERRGRIPRLRSRSHLLEPEFEIPLDPDPEPFNFGEMSIQVNQIDWGWLEERKRRPKERGGANEPRDASVDQPDDNEQVLLGRVEAVARVPVAARHPSFSPGRIRPCDCGAAQGQRILGHKNCAQVMDLRRRRKLRKMRYRY